MGVVRISDSSRGPPSTFATVLFTIMAVRQLLMGVFYAIIATAIPVSAIPITDQLIRRNPGISKDPPSDGVPYLALLAIAILVPVIIIGLLMYLYKRRHGHFPRFGHKHLIHEAPPINPTPIPSARTRRRGVWRSSQAVEDGVPGYTFEATDGELSLGMGRKLTDEECYELTETPGQPEGDRDNGDARSMRTQTSFATTAIMGDDGRSEVRSEVRSEMRRPSGGMSVKEEELPPYVPPPSPAMVTDRLYRAASIRSHGSSAGHNRLVYPRPAATPRR